MYKQTLEILPLAILLTVIMSFGAKSAQYGDRNPLGTPVRTGKEYSSESVKRISDYLEDVAEGSVTRVLSLDEIPVETAVSAASWLEAGADPNVAAIFIDRPATHAGIPYFTTRDVLRHSAFERRFLGKREALAGRSIAETSANRSETTNEKKVVVNTADEESLETIPGIGPSKAKMIISRRPKGGFKKWEELLDVPGIGESTLATIRLHAILEGR